MRAHILQKLNDLKTASGKSYEDAHEGTGYSTSTIHRWHKGESDPDLEQLTVLVEFYGGSMEDLFAAVGKQELAATQTIGYQGAEAMAEHYEERLKGKDALLDQAELHHQQILDQERGHHERSIAYLKEVISGHKAEIARLQGDIAGFTTKKNVVFWVLVGVIFALLIALTFALQTDAII